jgi:putative hydrolase of the HAD superfamily
MEFTRPGIWQLYPEVQATLSDLQPRIRLGIISNFDGRLRQVLANLGILSIFDPIVISSEVGADKPDPYIYAHACALAGVEPGRALHIGDDPLCDWQGARDAGLVSLELDRQKQTLTEVLAALL